MGTASDSTNGDCANSNVYANTNTRANCHVYTHRRPTTDAVSHRHTHNTTRAITDSSASLVSYWRTVVPGNHDRHQLHDNREP